MRVLKWNVPIDNRESRIGTGKIVLVASQHPGSIQVWTEEDAEPNLDEACRLVEVYGTGHDVPDGHTHLGSVVSPPFVWHLYAKRE